jgi:hypothetical protein
MKCKLVAVLFTLLMAAIAIANAAETKFTGAPAKSQEVLSDDWAPRIQEYFLTIP